MRKELPPVLQYTYDYVAEFLFEQNAVSVNADGECLYDGPNGTRCAIGCLLKLGQGKLFENFDCGVVPLASFRPEFTDGINDGNEEVFRDLLGDLQYIHDSTVNEKMLEPRDDRRRARECWIEQFLKLSENPNYGLDPGILITWMDDEYE